MTLTLLTDAYDSVANIDAYHANRGNTLWSSLSTNDKEVNIRKATDWIERNFRFRGTKKTPEQRLHWPAERAYDDNGYLIGTTDAPFQVKEACAIVADLYRDGSYDLEGIVTDDAAIMKQKVDVIEVQYDSAHRIRGGAVISHVHALLSSVTLGNELLRS